MTLSMHRVITQLKMGYWDKEDLMFMLKVILDNSVDDDAYEYLKNITNIHKQ